MEFQHGAGIPALKLEKLANPSIPPPSKNSAGNRANT